MKPDGRSKTKTIAIVLIAGIALLIAPAQRAHAYGQGAFAAGVIMVWATYVTVKGMVCTPVAAFKASKSKDGFGGAFKECWDWRPGSSGEVDERDAKESDEWTAIPIESSASDQLEPNTDNEDEMQKNQEDENENSHPPRPFDVRSPS